MVFAYDVEASLASLVALVNTLPELSDSGHDEMTSEDELDTFLADHRYSWTREPDSDELDGVRAIRVPLRGLWLAADEERAVEIVNGMLAEGGALPRLVRHGQWGWHVHATSDDRPLQDRILVESAMAWLDVIRSDERERMRVCAADDCEAVLVDLSRNRSKRYCDVGNCGNRANVAAYRARRSADAG